MLQNKLYTCSLGTENSSSNITVQFNKEHDIYKGHFPGKPVTPGVVLIQMVTELMQQCTGSSVKLKQITTSKFTHIHNPSDFPTINFQLQISQAEKDFKVIASAEKDGIVFFKINAIYQ
jgi:3-hydroxyacyl-[acyl-carrier-protein] dehydratase